MAPLETAVRGLRHVLGADPAAADWRWQVRRHLSEVKDALTERGARHRDGWLTARSGSSNRVRRQLLTRVTALSAGVLDTLDTDAIAHELRRLERDLEHYVQRLHDLVYDSVALEIGGSE